MADYTIDTPAEIITQLYVAYFDRAPDPQGLNYWIGKYWDGQGTRPDGKMTFAEIAENFALQTEAQDKYPYLKYPNLVSPDNFVAQVYQDLFGRSATSADIQYWSSQLSQGHISPGHFIAQVILSAQAAAADPNDPNHAQAVQDYETVQNKVAVGVYYAQQWAQHGLDWTSSQDLSGAQHALDGITHDQSTVTTAEQSVDALIQGHTTQPSQTFTLTDKIDTFDHVGDGLVKGIISHNGTDTTWDIADTISGGTSGSKMDVTAVVGNGSVSTTGRVTSGIEAFDIRFVDDDPNNGGTFTVDASTLTGAKDFAVVSATASNGDKVAFEGLAKTQTVTVQSDDKDLSLDLTYKTGEDSGSNDTASLVMDDGKLATVTVNGNFETVHLHAKSGSHEVATVTAAGNKMSSLTIAGSGAMKVGQVSGWSATATTKVIDASSATGDVTLGTEIDNKFDIKGGSGTDTIIDVKAADHTVDSNFKMTGVENFLAADANGYTETYNLTNATGLVTVGVIESGKDTTGNTVQFNNIGDGTTLLLRADKVDGDTKIGSAVTLTVKGATTSSPADKITVNMDNHGQDIGVDASGKEHVISTGTVTVNNVKEVDVNVHDASGELGLAADHLETLKVTGDHDVKFDTAVGAAAHTTTIDASGVQGAVTMTLVNDLQKDVTVTTGGGDDHITLGDQTYNGASSHTITVNTGAGDDTVTLGDNGGNAVINIDLGAGDDEVSASTASRDITWANNAHSIDFGTGTNTLYSEVLNGHYFDMSSVTLTNLTKVEVVGDGTNTGLLKVDAGSLSGKSIDVTEFDKGYLDLVAHGTGATVDASHFTVHASTGVYIDGTSGADTITGTSGGDVINGGAGADTITTGKGADKVVFDHFDYASDDISDFASGIDGLYLDFSTGGLTASKIAPDGKVGANLHSGNNLYLINTAAKQTKIPLNKHLGSAATINVNELFRGADVTHLRSAITGLNFATTVKASGVAIGYTTHSHKVYLFAVKDANGTGTANAGGGATIVQTLAIANVPDLAHGDIHIF